MVYLVGYDEFEALRKRVEAIEEENQFLRSLILGQHWLSKLQTMSVLQISETTLWRLTKSNSLTYAGDGRKTVYDINSVRDHLSAKKLTRKAVDDRLIYALHTFEAPKRST